jgi:predicted PurR-regulated permease PerM
MVDRMRPNPFSSDQFVSRTLIVLGLAATFGIVLFFLWWARHIFFLTFAGILLAVFLRTPAEWLHRRTRLPYALSLAVTVLAVLIVVGLLGWLVGARLSQQVGQLAQQLPASFQRVWSQFEGTAAGQTFHRLAPQAEQSLVTSDVLSQITGIASGVAQSLADTIVVLFVGLYGAAQPGWYDRGMLHLIPPARRNRVQQVLKEVIYTLRWWLVGQLFSMTVVGVLTGLGLWLIGVNLSLALGVLAFLLEIVPYIGPFLALVPAVLLAWTSSPWMALWVVALFAGIHVVEGYVIMPLVQVRTIRLPPAVHILALLLLYELGGILGILIAAPLVITIVVLVRMFYVEDVLGDWSAASSERELPERPAEEDKT